jgi:uncharacterized protein (TIGR03663 family)
MEGELKRTSSWLSKPLSSAIPAINVEVLIISLVLILALVTRFYNLGVRTMSHDEVNHVVPSWELYQGQGYKHDPITHGPLQFHLIALSFFLFGDSDTAARIPAALAGIATIAFVMIAFRRYLGRSGALVAGVMLLISPFMLYYSRYARNDIYDALFGVLTFYATWRYLEKGDRFSLVLLTGVIALHFATKEVAYIYTAQLLLFLAFLFFYELIKKQWTDEAAKRRFFSVVVIGVVLIIVTLGLVIGQKALSSQISDVQASPPPAAEVTTSSLGMSTGIKVAMIFTALAALAAFVFAIVVLVRNLGWKEIRSHRTFDLLMLVGTLIIPQLAAFGDKLIGWDPLDYTSIGMVRTAIFVVLTFVIAIVLGFWWNRRHWWQYAVLFYGIYVVLYTTFFTNGNGLYTGLIGGLGHWLAQQTVQRGDQPLYYYAAIQIPVYEFLAALGTILAAYFAIRFSRFMTVPGYSPAKQPEISEEMQETNVVQSGGEEAVLNSSHDLPKPLPIISLLLFWALTSLLAYSYAGERMPWLTVHIALPLILAAGWGLGYLIDSIDWKAIFTRRSIIAIVLIPVFLTSLGGLFANLLGTNPPFQGNTQAQLEATNAFVLAFVSAILSGGAMIWLLKEKSLKQITALIGVVFFIFLGVLTGRAAYRAAYINYDNAKEYLVYAHGANGPTEVLSQIEEISRRVTGGLNIKVAYDSDMLYPYWWYLRNYPNHLWFGENPTRDLADYPLIVASDATYGKLEPIVRDNYIEFDSVRLVWPNQDYYNLTWDRIWGAIKDPQMRKAVFNIWFNRDYTLYAQLTNNDTLTVENWQPSDRMRFYVRKDIVAQIWNYGTVPQVSQAVTEDPYLANMIQLPPQISFGVAGSEPGAFSAPRGIAVAPDGSLYVADSRNNRIEHFSSQGQLIGVWGSYGNVADNTAASGTFNEPWGVAVGPDGDVYVADTWNYRIQKFTPDGQFITMWGVSGGGESPFAFYGPRGLAFDPSGNLYVADTGNNRIVIFTQDGEYVSQFGSIGMELGQLDEPVDIAVDSTGSVYVTDTWNQRVQVFAPTGDMNFYPVNSWDVSAWYGRSVDNKPFIAVDEAGNVFITDPEGYRVLEFDAQGNFMRGWGDYSAGIDGFGLPIGITVDQQGQVWVADSVNNRILSFALPQAP